MTIQAIDVGLLVLRGATGAVMVAHGWNHIFGGGKIAGTARWFEGLGMRPGRLHAWTASLTELGAGVLLLLGLLTPLAGAAVVGVMVVAWVTNHRSNGFFIFRPGEGCEYVMTLTAIGLFFCAAGGGELSLDGLLGIHQIRWLGALAAAAVGAGGAVSLLLGFWRPVAKA